MKISLLHATYGAGRRAVSLRDTWLATARGHDIEHLFAYDLSDGVSRATPEIADRGLAGGPTEGVSAVVNWNRAAEASTGDLLFVIADDLEPPAGWAEEILSVIGALNPKQEAFVVKVADAPDPRDTLIRHPVVSRAYFERHGLFHHSYAGLYCDRDLTLTAFRHALVLDGRQVRLEHVHPSLRDVRPTASQQRMNRRAEYLEGRAIFSRRWPKWSRQVRREFYPDTRIDKPTVSRFAQVAWHARLRCLGLFDAARRVAASRPTSLWS